MPAITRIILFVTDIPKVADFYQRHFGMQPLPGADDGWLELGSPEGGCNIALHKTQIKRESDNGVKIVFGVADVMTFIAEKKKDGLKFGKVFEWEGLTFADTVDPCGNAVQVSSRGV